MFRDSYRQLTLLVATCKIFEQTFLSKSEETQTFKKPRQSHLRVNLFQRYHSKYYVFNCIMGIFKVASDPGGHSRFIFNIKESTLNTEVLAKTKWKSLSYIYKKRISTISYQAFYNRAPAGINSLFTKQSPLRNLRDGLKLYVQRPRSDFLRSSFSHRASLLWNNLPMYLKSKPNIVSFKSALKAKSDTLDEITFNGLQGINEDIVNYIY